MPHTISVIIPAYNAAKTMEKCLQSLHHQALVPLEIIVVDDGSTDGTVEIAEKYARVIGNTRKKGAGGARNSGALAAAGDVLAFTDSDCVLPPQWLQKIAAALDDEATGAVAGGYTHHEGRSLIGRFACAELEERRRGFPDYVNTAVSNNLAVRRKLFEEIDGFPESFRGATVEDLIFTYHISRKSRIRWLRDNGIGHHFPETMGGYLSQQYRFGRDTVVMYSMHPSIAGIRTHHGYSLYLETLAAGGALLGLARPIPWFIAGIALLIAVNIPFIMRLLVSGNMSLALFTALFIPLRDFNLLRSIAGGVVETMRTIAARSSPEGPGKQAGQPSAGRGTED